MPRRARKKTPTALSNPPSGTISATSSSSGDATQDSRQQQTSGFSKAPSGTRSVPSSSSGDATQERQQTSGFSYAPSGTRSAPSSSSGDATQEQQQTFGFSDAPSGTRSAPSSSSGDSTRGQQQTGVFDIFLSHSGQQKGFVERLNEHLVNAGHLYPFFDQHSIPKGDPFPDYIKHAANHAKLGVVVLSDDFMKSKWPMIELEILTDSSAKVVPIFFRLSPNDLKSATKLTEWREEWNKMAGVDVDRWENAIKSLAHQTGEVYRSPTSEGQYIKKIVAEVCRRLPPSLPYDLAYAQGQQRLFQEVDTRFLDTPIIGLYGIGGLGKTTLCRVMANFYSSAYSGKSIVLEFPTRKDEVVLVKKCKKVLKQLSGASEDLLKRVDCFDQVVRLMRDHMKRHVFFLAIDNVWAESLDEAKRILTAVYGYGSKLLVTSRSEVVLKDLLECYNAKCVGPVPSVNEKEALETFEASFEADLSCASQTSLKKAVKLCLFSGCYHPLALRGLGKKLKWMGDAREVEENLSSINLTLESSGVKELIKVNYDDLSRTLQLMFLDVAVTFTCTGSICVEEYDMDEMGFEEMRKLLSILYERERGDIHELLQQLALAGLLTLEGEGAKRRVVVHDLYVELAVREAAASPRFLLGDSTNMEAGRWPELERILWPWDRCAVKLHRDCPKLQLLTGLRLQSPQEVHLEGMKALRVLTLEWYGGNVMGLKDLSMLAVLQCEINTDNFRDVVEIEQVLQDLRSCRKLRSLILKITFCQYNAKGKVSNEKRIPMLPDLSALVDLEILILKNCYLEERGVLPSSLESISLNNCGPLLPPGIVPDDRLLDFSGIARLRSLNISSDRTFSRLGLPSTLETIALCGTGLKIMPDLSGMTRLQRLDLHFMDSLVEIGSLPSSLESIGLMYCDRLERVPDMSGITQLQELHLEVVKKVGEIGSLPCSLRLIELGACPTLERVPDLSGITQLQELSLEGLEKVGEIGSLPCSLQRIELTDCPMLERVPDLSGITQLQELSLVALEKVGEIGSLPCSLQRIELMHCPMLERVPDLSGITQLQDLSLILEKVGEIGSLPCSLQRIELTDCSMLERVPDLRGITQLQELSLVELEKVGEIGSLPCSLRWIELYDCPMLERVPDLSGLARLRYLNIQCLPLEQIENLPSNLEELKIYESPVQRIPDLSRMVRLLKLEIWGCQYLEEIEGLPPNLESFDFRSCPNLRRIPLRCISLIKKDKYRGHWDPTKEEQVKNFVPSDPK